MMRDGELSSQDWSALDTGYDDQYHAARLEGSARSAAVIVPMLLELFPSLTSVVDVGCSAGAWLHQFQIHGISRVLGLDGADVSPALLQVDPAEFRRVDFCQPIPSLGRFDLAISLEVADCLPQQAAQGFVTSLTRMSDLIVFSAATPGQSLQPGVNERWPNYWIGLFAANRFACFDILRDRLWYDQRINWWYAQNMLVFARGSRKDLVSRLGSIPRRVPALDMVHPLAFQLWRSEASIGPATLKLFPFELIEEGYKEYNILKVDVDKFLALAHSEGPYSPEKLAAGGYKHAYVAGSAEEVKALIPRPAFVTKLVEEGYKGYNILQIEVDKFLAVAQAEGAFSPEKLAAGAYRHALVGQSVDQLKRRIRVGTRAKNSIPVFVTFLKRIFREFVSMPSE
jgi:SAM-dependent methyltransferase